MIQYGIELELAAKRSISGEWVWEFGDFYDGTIQTHEISLEWVPTDLLDVQLTAEYNNVRLPDHAFTEQTIEMEIGLNFSTDLQFTAIIQYEKNDDRIGINSRLRWTIHPNLELFVVLNRGMEQLRENRWETVSDFLAVKFKYKFRD